MPLSAGAPANYCHGLDMQAVAPIELQSTNETDSDSSLNNHLDPVSCIGEDEDISLSLDLPRAYPRRQMEELLIKIG